MSKVARDVAIALACVVLTFLFDFVTAMSLESGRLEELERDHLKLLQFIGKPFDLWTVAFAIIVGVALSDGSKRDKLIGPLIASVVALLAIIAALFMGSIFHSPYWGKIFIPDLIGLLYIAFTVSAARV